MKSITGIFPEICPHATFSNLGPESAHPAMTCSKSILEKSLTDVKSVKN